MATINAELRQPDGQKTRPSDINADDSTLGQALISVDDGSGGKKTAFTDLPDSSGGDPGIPTGTPGNLGPLTLSAGSGVIIANTPAAATRVADFAVVPISLNLANVGALKMECPVLAAGPSGAKIGIRGIKYAGDTPTLLGTGGVGPFVAVDTQNLIDGVLWANSGDYFDVDPAFQINNVNCELVVYGGDGATETIIGNVYIFAVSVGADVPPFPETPDPEVPDDGVLFAAWLVTEGSGQFVENKIVGGVTPRRLTLGDNTGTTTRDPTWTAGPRRLATLGFATVDHHYAFSDDIPSLAAGCALFFYGDITTLGGLTKYLCGVEDGANTDHTIQVVDVGGVGKARAQITENTGGGTSRTATGTTTIANGSKHLFGLVHNGTTLGVYVDPDDGLPEATTACAAAFEVNAPPRRLVIGAGRTPTTGINGPDVWAFGDVALYVGASVPNAAAIAELYAAFKLVYTDLP